MRRQVFYVALAVAVIGGGQAGADVIPMSQTGPFVIHLTNYDDGVVYDWNGGFLADNQTPIVTGTAYDPLLVKTLFDGYATRGGEDSWGIFKLDQILLGEITGPNGITPVGPSTLLYTDGDAGLEVVGIFYGRSDVSVAFLTDGDLGTQQIRSTGDNYEVFTQPKGTYNDGGIVGGPGATLRVDANEYPGVGYDGSATDTLLPGAERVLTGFSQAGLVADEVVSIFTPDAGGSGNGVFALYVSLGEVSGFVGTQNALFDSNTFPNGGAVASVGGITADLRLKGTTEPTNKEWLARSSDPLSGYIPEPVSAMLMLFGAAAVLRRPKRG